MPVGMAIAACMDIGNLQITNDMLGIGLTYDELQEQFKSISSINAELKRIAPIKANHRIWAQWGHVEHKEYYKRMLAYERRLKQIKQQLKKQPVIK